MHILNRFWKYFGKYKLFLILSVISAIVTGTAGMVGHLVSGRVFDAMAGKGLVDFGRVIYFLIWIAVLYTAQATFDKLLRVFSNRMAYLAVRDIRDAAFDKLDRLPLSYLDNHPQGDIISRFVGDMDSVSDAISLGLSTAMSGAVSITTCIICMFYLNWSLALVVLLITPLNLLGTFVVSKMTHNSYARQQQVLGDLTSFSNERVGNEKVLIALGDEERSAKVFSRINKKYYYVNRHAQFISSITNPIARFLNHLTYVLLGVVGGLQIIRYPSQITVGILSSFFIYGNEFSKPFNDISGITAQIQTAFASLRRMFAFLDEKEEVPDKENPTAPAKVEGRVAFSHVRFSYTPQKPLIRDLSLVTQPGDLIAIVGPTGAGKTTLVNLLMRFYEVDRGSIILDGVNTKEMVRDSLRRQFGMVLQDTWLFRGTVAENIAYAKPEATREEIIKAAKDAYAHNFITHLPGGYDSMLEEDGGNLSGGQRQLLTIARVMVMDPPMLILDEATSSVDTLTEVRIQKALNRIMEGRTSFVIAHRLSTIVSADRILVMDHGDIVEQGTHQELLALDRVYAQLYYSQFQ